MFKEEISKYDPFENAHITMGSNYIPWENTRKCVEELKLIGYNYAEYLYEKDHMEHPDWTIFGSETASVVMSRGIYHFPAKECIMADDDEQCSSLDNCATSWGAKSIRKCVTDDRDANHVFGMFIWTGFDYIGEPTPYHTKNSYFGVIDTAGFNKDPYYIYKSAWRDVKDEPFVHIFPYWDYNEGQLIDLRVASNAPCVEAFLNGVSLGKKYFDRKHDLELLATYEIPYTKGEIVAVGYDENGKEIAREEKKSFGNPKKLVLSCDKVNIKANGADITYVTVEAVDEFGVKVENANNQVKITVSGAGRLLGLDNGDSTDFDPYKTNVRKLFSGKLVAAIGSLEEAGEIRIKAEGILVESDEIIINSLEAEKIEGVSCIQRIENCELNENYVPIRRITLKTDKGQKFTEDLREIEVEAVIEPSNATFDDIVFRSTNNLGVTSNLAKVVKTDKKNVVILKALGDGEFRLRATANNGDSRVKVISELEFTASGIGEAFLNPYDFIAGSLATISNEERGNGNERGVATGHGSNTWVGYERVDFGPFGSDMITIPIFELDNKPTPFEIWDGIPNEEGSEKLADCIYDKKMIWNEYQAESYKLSRRMKGMRTLCFMFHKKVHIKGFLFEKQNKAYAYLTATDNQTLYGDTFTVSKSEEGVIEHIGNNVTMLYDAMDFDNGTTKLVIEGKSSLPVNTIHVRFRDESGEIKKICEFEGSDEFVKRTFDIGTIKGKYDVSFVFLPGCDFTFKGFKFEK
ncbi:MAG: DUF4982 domain-containing protein, partial [Lachnospiraceae bacterium]|nr:DUF4982 domain-containing protein [Lachnospiraceae bacterium]